MAAIECDKLKKTYVNQDILCGLNLRITAGEFFGLVGVNGAGKTTLIKCLLDFCELSSGAISIFGVAHTLTHARSQLAYLPEKFSPPYYLTGQDFMRYMGNLYGCDFSTAAVAEMLKVLDLEPSALRKPVRELSKGMAQKLGLAACLLSRRRLIIMDEPMSGLDPRARAYLKSFLLEIKQEHTFFFCTHLLNDVESLCDSVGILHQGYLKYRGSPAQCCEQYQCDDFEQAYLRCVDADGLS